MIKKTGKNVLLTPLGTRGDVLPLISVGSELLEYGWRVAVCATTEWESEAYKSGMEFLPLGFSYDEQFTGTAANVGKRFLGLRVMHKEFINILRKAEKPLLKYARDFDLMIGSSLFWSALSIAEHYTIPYYHCSWSSVVMFDDNHLRVRQF